VRRFGDWLALSTYFKGGQPRPGLPHRPTQPVFGVQRPDFGRQGEAFQAGGPRDAVDDAGVAALEPAA
jgi:hypothetical protein